jgi:hypothetical protein
MAYDPSARVFRGSNLLDLYMFPGMKDVRKDVDCRLSCNRVAKSERKDGGLEELQEFARRKLLTTTVDN